MRIHPTAFLLSFVAIYVLTATAVAAHPHVFVDSRMEAHFSGGELTHVSAHWTFDRFFTHQILRDFGLDQSGNFSDSEIAEVRSGAFENLRNYDYFIYIEVDGRSIDSNNPRNFDASLDSDGHLVYSFDIPVGVDVTREEKRVEVAMYDEEYFVDMAFADDYLNVSGTMPVEYDHTIEENIYDTGIWGPMVRERVVMEIRGGL